MKCLVSICIPTYKQPEMFERCLRSITIQTYKQIEVVVSDDTPDNSVKIIVDKFVDQLNLSYQKNSQQLGTPANWNAAVQKAKGDYVLLLHHDDFFASAKSLETFLAPFTQNGALDFAFGLNPSIEGLQRNLIASDFFRKYYTNPFLLLIGNYLGAPSNVLLRANVAGFYNPKYKWIVDIEFYIRLFQQKKQFHFINEKLVEIGIHGGQVSNECADNIDILLLENVSYAAETNMEMNSIKLYDFYWRLLRNGRITSTQQLLAAGIEEKNIPEFIKRMVKHQAKVPKNLLHSGIFSKTAMFISYVFY